MHDDKWQIRESLDNAKYAAGASNEAMKLDEIPSDPELKMGGDHAKAPHPLAIAVMIIMLLLSLFGGGGSSGRCSSCRDEAPLTRVRLDSGKNVYWCWFCVDRHCHECGASTGFGGRICDRCR